MRLHGVFNIGGIRRSNFRKDSVSKRTLASDKNKTVMGLACVKTPS